MSRKLVSMMLSTILMAADPKRSPDWVMVGRSMVAIDSLVHNFLHRTGILTAYAREHPYGQRCFGAAGCDGVIRDLVARLREHRLGTESAPPFPRGVQRAIWRFCAGSELDVCNGRNIDDKQPCQLSWCPLWAKCSRLPLRRAADPETQQ